MPACARRQYQYNTSSTTIATYFMTAVLAQKSLECQLAIGIEPSESYITIQKGAFSSISQKHSRLTIAHSHVQLAVIQPPGTTGCTRVHAGNVGLAHDMQDERCVLRKPL